MPYTPDVPQANQQIAATQQPINANFQFINADLRVEHTFNGNTSALEGTHLKASMPNLAGGDPVALPTNTNGMYYVLGGNAKFIDSSLNISQLTLGSPTANGYQWIGRVLIQWGFLSQSFSAGSFQNTLNFNIPFPNACFIVQCQLTRPGTSTSNIANISINSVPSETSFQWNVISASTSFNGFFWMAIGN